MASSASASIIMSGERYAWSVPRLNYVQAFCLTRSSGQKALVAKLQRRAARRAVDDVDDDDPKETDALKAKKGAKKGAKKDEKKGKKDEKKGKK